MSLIQAAIFFKLSISDERANEIIPQATNITFKKHIKEIRFDQKHIKI